MLVAAAGSGGADVRDVAESVVAGPVVAGPVVAGPDVAAPLVAAPPAALLAGALPLFALPVAALSVTESLGLGWVAAADLVVADLLGLALVVAGAGGAGTRTLGAAACVVTFLLWVGVATGVGVLATPGAVVTAAVGDAEVATGVGVGAVTGGPTRPGDAPAVSMGVGVASSPGLPPAVGSSEPVGTGEGLKVMIVDGPSVGVTVAAGVTATSPASCIASSKVSTGALRPIA